MRDGRKRVGRLLGIGCFIAVILSTFLQHAGAADGPLAFPTSELSIRVGPETVHDFTVELASTPAQHRQGLMFRRSLEADRGMLFVYDPVQTVSMWMKNTYISLDMLFIAPDGRIRKIVERAEPKSTRAIGSGGPVKAVLELRGGTSDRLDIAAGDRVEHPLLR